MLNNLKEQAYSAASEIIEVAGLKKGQILVVGCSTSEILGSRIGTDSSPDTAKEVFDGIYKAAQEKGIFLACQCCEHLNRALIVERTTAERFGYEPVCVRPVPKAGGSFATTVYGRFCDPVLVEQIAADAGLDIGLTLIGMHLKRVAVPVRPSLQKIGCAALTAAVTRPKYIGGERAQYV